MLPAALQQEASMPSDYNPIDWYWFVNGDETRVFSSKSGSFVQPSDAAYAAWLAQGNAPTRIASKAELGEVLAPYQIRPSDVDVLDGYQDAHSKKITLEVVAKLLLWLVNEVRTLKGQPTVTANQFRAFVKGLM
jgi:hypothetical protein